MLIDHPCSSATTTQCLRANLTRLSYVLQTHLSNYYSVEASPLSFLEPKSYANCHLLQTSGMFLCCSYYMPPPKKASKVLKKIYNQRPLFHAMTAKNFVNLHVGHVAFLPPCCHL